MVGWETTLDEITRFIFGLICHQDPSILIKVGGREVLLCPRCMGLHLGFLSSFIVIALWTSDRIRVVRREALFAVAAAVGSMAIDWGVGGYLGFFAPSSFSRLATGLASGSALSLLAVSYRQGRAKPPQSFVLDLTGVQTTGLICFSLCLGLALVTLSNWVLLSSVLLFAVIANASLVIHTVALILRSRPVKLTVVPSSPFNRGGEL
jgi:uncharacterized membrane protein